jgi:alpha-beta hydrolase superfamily lysophospholipase
MSMRAPGPRRFQEQRWVIDETIRRGTIEFDQPRLAYHLGLIRDELAAADIGTIRSGVHKLADHVPVVRRVAERRERFAREAEGRGHHETAAVHWYAAAQAWSLACWPVWEDQALVEELNDRKNAAYRAWGAHCGHRVEKVDVPFGDGAALPAWFHLPSEGTGPFPTLLACGGMDAPREILVARVGDPWLARDVAVLAVDGPGQGEAAIRGVHVSPRAWIDAGAALVDWLQEREEVDSERVVCSGTSFGSHWMTEVAATQPIFRGCAAALPVFEPGARTIFEVACPTYKARHMWMAGLFDDEAAFDELAAGYDLRPLVQEMQVPWLVIGGTADELSPTRWVDELTRLCPAPSSITRYAGGRHSITETSAAILGPHWKELVVDWLHDRVLGKPAEDEHHVVTPSGEVVELPHPRAAQRLAQ